MGDREGPAVVPVSVPGADDRDDLAAIRQETTNLREILLAFQEAFEGALLRLESLDARLADVARAIGGAPDDATGATSGAGQGQVGGGLSSGGGGGVLRLRRGSRLAPPWKQPGALEAAGQGAGTVPAGAGRHRGHATGEGRNGAVTGETLRARREALGISQAAVAHAAHCSRGLVAEVERGKRRAAQTLSHLASTLDRLEGMR